MNRVHVVAERNLKNVAGKKMESKFKTGDVVRVIGIHGPKMTIDTSSKSTYGRNYYVTKWFNNNYEILKADFYEENLELVDEERT